MRVEHQVRLGPMYWIKRNFGVKQSPGNTVFLPSEQVSRTSLQVIKRSWSLSDKRSLQRLHVLKLAPIWHYHAQPKDREFWTSLDLNHGFTFEGDSRHG